MTDLASMSTERLHEALVTFLNSMSATHDFKIARDYAIGAACIESEIARRLATAELREEG